MEQINLRHPTIAAALNTLKADLVIKHGIDHYTRPDEFSTLFEKKYNCTIVAEDAYCTEGYLKFIDEQYQTLFLLQFSEAKNGN